MSVTEIISGLWIGDKKISQNFNFFNSKKIECVINCSQKIPNSIPNTVRLPVLDNLREEEIDKMYRFLPKVTERIHQQLKSLKNVLVHCHAGKQRSATVVAAYLIKYTGINVDTAINIIRTKRSMAFSPGVNFKKSLLKFQEDLMQEI